MAGFGAASTFMTVFLQGGWLLDGGGPEVVVWLHWGLVAKPCLGS